MGRTINTHFRYRLAMLLDGTGDSSGGVWQHLPTTVIEVSTISDGQRQRLRSTCWALSEHLWQTEHVHKTQGAPKLSYFSAWQEHCMGNCSSSLTLRFCFVFSVPTLPPHLTGSQCVLGFDAEAWIGKKEKQQWTRGDERTNWQGRQLL